MACVHPVRSNSAIVDTPVGKARPRVGSARGAGVFPPRAGGGLSGRRAARRARPRDGPVLRREEGTVTVCVAEAWTVGAVGAGVARRDAFSVGKLWFGVQGVPA